MKRFLSLILLFACLAAIVSFSGCSLEDSATNGYYITEVKNYDSEGKLKRHDFYYYNSDMRPAKIESYEDGKHTTTLTMSYDEKGNLIQRIGTSKTSNSLSEERFEYDNRGRKVKETAMAYHNADIRDEEYVGQEKAYEYIDLNGSHILTSTTIFKTSTQNEPIKSTFTSTNYVDSHGNIYKSVSGEIDAIESLYTIKYENGKLISESSDIETFNYYYDENGNKIKDEYIYKEKPQYNYTNEYSYSKTPEMI